MKKKLFTKLWVLSLEYLLIVAVVKGIMEITFSIQYVFWSTGAFLSKFAVCEGTNEIVLTAYSAH